MELLILGIDQHIVIYLLVSAILVTKNLMTETFPDIAVIKGMQMAFLLMLAMIVLEVFSAFMHPSIDTMIDWDLTPWNSL